MGIDSHMKPDLWRTCSEGLLRAQPVNSVLPLRAHAVRQMPRVHDRRMLRRGKETGHLRVALRGLNRQLTACEKNEF